MRLSLFAGALLASACATSTSPVDGDAGAGAPHDCFTASDCAAPSTPCALAICNAGSCQTQSVPKGTVLTKHAPPDCEVTVCDGSGNTEDAIDGSNAPPSSDPCLVGTCDVAGTPSAAPVSAGTACTSPSNGHRCDGAGHCVQCLDAGDCGVGEACSVSDTCLPAPCVNGVKDGNETDVDCGGACPACAAGATCAQDSDCKSKACDPTAHTCLSMTCGDQRKDGDETGVDCGGSCPMCALGTACSIDADCFSNACDGVSMTCVADQCSDHRMDDLETDVDCGGGICAPCARYLGCMVDTDCTTNACDVQLFRCVTNQCADHHKDGTESDVDCGGFYCTGCAAGKTCNLNYDCRVGLQCNANVNPHVCQ